MTIIIASVAAVVVLAVMIGVFATINNNKTGDQKTKTPTTVVQTDTTPTPEATPTPKAEQVDPTAASIITGIQTSSAVDEDTFSATNPTTSFTTDDYVYVVFQLDVSNVEQKNGIYGYVQVKYYEDGKVSKSGKLDIDQNSDAGYFYIQYDNPTNNGKAELYWCTKSDCSDAKLAQTVAFIVTD
jgi:hypothetical protein